jgi:hypothetical protein
VGARLVDHRCDRFRLRKSWAALNGINCARFDLPTGFARNLRLNSADDDVRRGDESLEAKMLMKIGFFVFLSALSNGFQNASGNDWKLMYLKSDGRPKKD